jgi:hypothetical protein
MNNFEKKGRACVFKQVGGVGGGRVKRFQSGVGSLSI